jgi:prepilin peptidase CpaA
VVQVGLSFQRSVPMIVQSICLSIIISIALFTDLKSRKIPNYLTLGGALIGFIINGLTAGLSGIQASALGWILGLALLLIPFFLGGMGAGDVKLMAAIGAWMGTAFVLQAMLWTALVGGVIAGFYLLRQWRWMGVSFFKIKTFIPYGVAIFIGTVVELLRINGYQPF